MPTGWSRLRPRGPALREGLPLYALLVGWGVFWLPHVLGRDCLPARDLGATQAPWHTQWRAQVERGWAPIWDPASNGGRPLLANPNAMAAYPGALLFLIGPAEQALVWNQALTHLILIAGLYRLTRRAGMSRGAAAVGAAAAATCGVAWSGLTFTNVAASLAWSTWALGRAVPAPRSSREALRRAVGGGCFLGVAFLAGEPVTAGLAAAAFAAIAMWQWRGVRWSLVACAGAAVAVAAPVLVPLVVTYPGTARGVLGIARGAIGADALAPRRLPELLLPGLLGPGLADPDAGFWAAASFPWQRYFPLLFVGGLPLLVLGRRSCTRPVTVWGVVASAGVVLASLAGFSSLGPLLGRLPGVSMVRFGIKFLVLPAVALAPLVGAGWQALVERWREVGRGACRRVVVGAIAVAAIGCFPEAALRPVLATLYPASRPALQHRDGSTLRESLVRDAALVALPAAVLLLAGASPTLAVVSAFVANTVSGRDALPFDHAARWARPPRVASDMTPGTRLACFADLAEPPDEGVNPILARFWRERAALQPSFGERWGLQYVLDSGPDGLEPAREALLAKASSHLDLAARSRVARALGADIVVAEKPVPGFVCRQLDGIWQCKAPPTPKWYLAQRLLPAGSPAATLETLAAASFHPGEDAVEDGNGAALSLAGGTVEERSGSPHHRRFGISTAGPGLLVVLQSFAPCWRARVDGVPVPVEPVNGAATGVRVPAGRHEVELLVDLAPYQVGLVGPGLALLALIVTRRGRPSRGRRAPNDATARSTPATGETSPP